MPTATRQPDISSPKAGGSRWTSPCVHHTLGVVPRSAYDDRGVIRQVDLDTVPIRRMIVADLSSVKRYARGPRLVFQRRSDALKGLDSVSRDLHISFAGAWLDYADDGFALLQT